MKEYFRSDDPEKARKLISDACLQIRYMKMRNNSQDEGVPPVFAETFIDKHRADIPFIFSTEEMPAEVSTFFSTKRKRPEIFITCPRCNRRLHNSVCDTELGCYSCQRGDNV